MKENNRLAPLFFMGASLLFSPSLKATATETNEDELSTLLSPEERALVEKELEKLSSTNESPQKVDTPQKEPDSKEESSNPYATLLEDSGVSTTKEAQQAALKKSKTR